MVLGYLQYSPFYDFVLSSSFASPPTHSLNLCKATSAPLISGNCFLKICNRLVLNPKDLLNSHLLDFFEVSDVAARALLGTPLLPYFSVPSISLLYWLPSLWPSSRFFWSPSLGGILSTQKRMPKAVSPATPTFLLSSRPACWKPALQGHAATSNPAGPSRALYYSKQVHLLSSYVAGACLYTGEPWRNPYDFCYFVPPTLDHLVHCSLNVKCVFSRVWLCHPMDCSLPGSSSMEFSLQESWSRLLSPARGDLLNPGIKSASLASPALAGGFFTTEHTWEAHLFVNHFNRLQALWGQWLYFTYIHCLAKQSAPIRYLIKIWLSEINSFSPQPHTSLV